jgi:hypothetical protein
MLSDDEFDTMIQRVIAGPPTPAAGPAPRHRVLAVVGGCALVLAVAIELRVFLLLWHLHG